METINLGLLGIGGAITENLSLALSTHPSLRIHGTAETANDLLRTVGGRRLNIVLIDVSLPGVDWIDEVRHLRKADPKTDFIVFTDEDDDDVIMTALAAGVCSYVSKRTPFAELRKAIFSVHRGGAYLSPIVTRKIIDRFAPEPNPTSTLLTSRQLEIVNGLAEGLSYKLIADRLHISIDTVRYHIRKIYRLLGVNCKMEVIRKAVNGELDSQFQAYSSAG